MAVTHLRQSPYRGTNGKTPLQVFMKDEIREVDILIPEIKKTEVENIFSFRYMQIRPDLNSNWTNCIIIAKIGNKTYTVTDMKISRLTRRTKVKIKKNSCIPGELKMKIMEKFGDRIFTGGEMLS
uniref:DUF5641 domain-containing protein n=1 Tax=Strongyloides stercoralis TaxID=6248 RepID=A0A0K0EAZ2_STRER